MRHRALRSAVGVVAVWVVARAFAVLLPDGSSRLLWERAPKPAVAVTAKPSVRHAADSSRMLAPDDHGKPSKPVGALFVGAFREERQRFDTRRTIANRSVSLRFGTPPQHTSTLQNESASGSSLVQTLAPTPQPVASILPAHPLLSATVPVDGPLGSAQALVDRTSSRLPFTLSAWLIGREVASARSLAANGQLGGSQAGFRLGYGVLRRKSRPGVDLSLRGSTSLRGRADTEIGAGISVRPSSNLPIEVIAERRVAIMRGGRNAIAVILAGGVDDRPLGHWRLSAYGQAGVVGMQSRDAFVDGSVRIARPLGVADKAWQAGAGIWGGSQPGTARLDAGPFLTKAVSSGTARASLSISWRQRIAGRAEPGSGPAISITAGF